MSIEPDRVTDATLIGLLTDGDPAALESLYTSHGRALYSLALRIMGDPRDAERRWQDTFLQLWRKSFQFDLKRGSLIGWLPSPAIAPSAAFEDDSAGRTVNPNSTILRCCRVWLRPIWTGKLPANSSPWPSPASPRPSNGQSPWLISMATRARKSLIGHRPL